jgi:hypothetical protein
MRGPIRRSALTVSLLALAGGAGATSDDVPPGAVLGVLPFATDVPYRVHVDLAPEGNRPFVWILDTGAEPNVMTPLAAREQSVSVRATKSSPYRRKTRLGRDVHFWVDTSSSDTRSRTGWEYSLLGGEFLEEFVVEIDFPARVVRFLDPKKYEVPKQVSAPDERVVRMRVAGKRPFVEIALGGKKTWVLFDTGAPDMAILSGPTANKLGIDWKALPAFGSYGTTLGPMDVRLHETESFELAGFTFPRVPVAVAPRGAYNMGGNTDSVIGYDVMRPFVVRLDYRRERMWLRRAREIEATYLGVPYELTRSAGAFLDPLSDGSFLISGVVPGSPAAAIGLRPGDRPVQPAGAERLDVRAFLERVAKRDEVVVARREDDVWIHLALPDPTASTEASGVSAPPP